MKNVFKIKYSAFTLAELMVIMAVMTVVLAAVAPIFTSRYSNVSFDNVWSMVGASNNNDIYNDAPGRSMMQESLIGITPIDMEDIRKTYQPYSKVIIRSSNNVKSGATTKRQKQIEFRYAGSTIGYLFAGNLNILMGGLYNNVVFNYNSINIDTPTLVNPDTSNAVANTALGIMALNSLTKGKYNSAFGYYALSNLTNGENNTAVGVGAGGSLTTGNSNVIIGYHSYDAQTGNYNTIIGNNSASKSSVSNYTTAIGNDVNVKGDYNVAVGDSANAGGKYNTAIGYAALASENPASDSYTNFEYNTAIGYKSCSKINASSKYTTCIGGVGVDTTQMSSTAQNFFKDSKERVLIGPPVTNYNSAATLEVHNLSSSGSKYPYPGNISGASNLGDSSVVVNGNLIVRGQTYLAGKSPFPMKVSDSATYFANTIALMGYKLHKEAISSHKPFMGFDGSEYTLRLKNQDNYMHETYAGREHCICSYSCTLSNKDYTVNGKVLGYRGKDAYEWSYLHHQSYDYVIDNTLGGYNYFWGSNPNKCGTQYNDNLDSGANIELNMAHNITDGKENSSAAQFLSGGSCCPILTPNGVRPSDQLTTEVTEGVASDARLKNITGKFTAGLEELNALNFYNYTFKADKSKTPNVGVIAQDLKRVFPNSVSKDTHGFYKIRWDEMFYSAINAVKTLYSKIVKLSDDVENNLNRLNKLNKEHKELEKRLIILSQELDKLEQ